MSFYRKHQRLLKFEELSNFTRFLFPTVLTMKIGGCSIMTDTFGHGCGLLVGAAVVSVIGWSVHEKAVKALNKFTMAISTNSRLGAQYEWDARIGKHDDMIADLQGQQTAALMAAAFEAKRGRAITAGFFYAAAKRVESRLRQHGQ